LNLLKVEQMKKNKLTPTEEQKRIIEDRGNCVVIAAPGSGKTFVLSEKIKCILDEVPDYKGVIAISFTNKASDELKRRSLEGGYNPKNSFFGTIDSFCFVEIIIAFGKHIFGYPEKEFDVIESSKLPEPFKQQVEGLSEVGSYDDLTEDHLKVYGTLFQKGIILLDSLGILANYVFDNSKACRLYLKARYSHVIIDEYQDSGYEQHLIFTKLADLGVKAVAVGDVNQAIFGFAGKDMKYLRSLVGTDGFQHHSLLTNFRCHVSISNYAKKFIGTFLEGFKPTIVETDDIRVFEKQVIGHEHHIASWIDTAIPVYCETYGISDLGAIGILVSSNRKGAFFDGALNTSSRHFVTTELDKEINLWGMTFRRLLLL